MPSGVLLPAMSALKGLVPETKRSKAVQAAPDVTRPVLDYQTVPGGHQLSLLNTLTFLTTAFKVSQVRIIYGGGNTAKVHKTNVITKKTACISHAAYCTLKRAIQQA